MDVGTGKPIPLSVKDMKIAFVASGMWTPLGLAQKKGVEEVAKKLGVPVTTFDGRIDAARRFSPYQTVVGRREVQRDHHAADGRPAGLRRAVQAGAGTA